MDKAEKELNKKFLEIKKKGWIKSIQSGTSGIGITFEKLIGVANNDFEIPDYNGIEIKTKRRTSKSYITLFSATPDGPHFHEVERLRNEYGYPHSKSKEYKVLNNSVFANVKNKIGIDYYFQLKIDREQKKLFLAIFDKKRKIIEEEVFWYFETLEEKLYRKLRIMALISTDTKKIDNIEYFKYSEMKIYSLKDFNTFISLLEQGIIRISFKINVVLSGPKKGKIHDHGTSFEIQEQDLSKLYNIYEV